MFNNLFKFVENTTVNSILNIVVVFAVLLVLIAAIYFISKLMDSPNKEEKKPQQNVVSNRPLMRNVEIKDDDMMVAVLIATIDYREEVKTDVKLINVREVK